MGSKVWLMSIAAIACSIPSFAFATLGKDIDSVQADQRHMQGSRKVMGGDDKYTVHEIQMPSGTAVREYVDTEGRVFAVAWRGPSLPDVRQILGPYFEQYSEAAGAKHAGHAHLTVRRSGFVMQSSGHMRAFYGRAYIPQLLPKGMAREEIQ